MTITWILILVASLAILVKSADWLVESAEKIALAFNVSPFIVGVSVVALGTSLPEVATTVTAVLKGTTEFVVDTAFGSNIATILLIIGVAAIVGKKLKVTRSLVNLDAPLLSVSTVLITFMVFDRKVTFWEGVILMVGFLIYVFYTFFQRHPMEKDEENLETLPSRAERRKTKTTQKTSINMKEKIGFKTILFLIVGIIGLAIGSNYAVESVTQLGRILSINASFLAITAIAVGTSLPELAVSVKAAMNKKYEIALGNVFGSNVFTIFLVIGLPALIKPLAVNEATFVIGVPYLIAATFLFVISGISKKIHIWEGLMYLLIFILFVVQFFNFSI